MYGAMTDIALLLLNIKTAQPLSQGLVPGLDQTDTKGQTIDDKIHIDCHLNTADRP